MIYSILLLIEPNIMHPWILKHQEAEGLILPSDIYRAWKRRVTLIEMMRDRGYTIDDDEQDILKGDWDGVPDIERLYVRKRDNNRLGVVYAQKDKNLASELKNRYETDYADDFIVVSETHMKNRDWYKELKFHVEFFDYNDLALNPVNHSLNPPHYLLTNKEKNNFYQTSGIQPRELPGIGVSTNPIARYYAAKSKDIIKIDRRTILNYYVDKFEYYREVKEIPIVASAIGADDAENDEMEEGEEAEAEADAGIEAEELY